jgi:hypothetical protein
MVGREYGCGGNVLCSVTPERRAPHMEQTTNKEISERHQAPESQNTLHLELTVTDPTVTKYLSTFDEPFRQEKAIEALRVGVIAIQSASPTLDTRIVEEKFREIEGSIDKYISDFETDIKSQFDEYFKTGSGSVPRSLDTLFGNNGTVTQLLNQYFGADTGRVLKLLQDQIGPSSPFAKSLDPNNKESVISRLQETVKTHIETEASKIVKEFSLDTDGSALSRLNALVSDKVNTIEASNVKFFAELKEALGIRAGKATEAEKGTEKGREFETTLYSYVAEVARALGDSSENVRSLVGSIERCKTGDYVITLSEFSAAPGHNIVIEAKKMQGYKLKDAIAELKEAKENRVAAVGILAFAKGYEPAEVGDFLRVGSDFFVTVDEEWLTNHTPLLYLDAAYKILRALIVTAARKEAKKELNVEGIRTELESIIALVARLSELSTKAKTISTNSKFIEETVAELKGEIEPRLNQVLKLLSQ